MINIPRGEYFYMIKAWLIALILICQAPSVLAAATLRGVVLENQIGGSPVKKVQVTTLGGANQAVTGDDGQFVLVFPKRQPGEDVSINVKHGDWVVVNAIQLTRTLPINAMLNPLEILICKKADLNTWALQFYRLKGQQVVDTSYERKLAELKSSNAAGTKELERLQRERDQARAQVEEMARQIASHPGRGEDESYQKAMSLFLDGRMDEALEMLSEERLRRQAEDEKKQEEGTKKKKAQNLQSWLLRGQLLALKFDFDAAARSYGNAVKFAPDSYIAWMHYSRFHNTQFNFTESTNGFEKAVSLARSSGKDGDIAASLDELSLLYLTKELITKAMQANEEALEIFKKLASKSKTDADRHNVAMSLDIRSTLYRFENRMAEALQTSKEVLDIYKKLKLENNDFYLGHLAIFTSNLSLLYRDENRITDALQATKEALEIFKKL